MSDRCFIAVFESEADVLGAVRTARRHRHVLHDVHTPYAVHGLDEAMGLRPSRLSWACLAFAIMGASIGLWLQYWTSAVDWPLNVGGKPHNSLPAFVPVTFELAVLLAGLGTVATLFVRSGLRPGRRAVLVDPRVTDDRFALVIRETDATFDPAEVSRLLHKHHPVWCGELVDGHVNRLTDIPPPEAAAGPLSIAEHLPVQRAIERSKHRKRVTEPVAGGSLQE